MQVTRTPALTRTRTLLLTLALNPTPNPSPYPYPYLHVQTDSKDSGKLVTATATVKLMDVSSGEEFMEASIGVGPVDATFKVTRTLA